MTCVFIFNLTSEGTECDRNLKRSRRGKMTTDSRWRLERSREGGRLRQSIGTLLKYMTLVVDMKCKLVKLAVFSKVKLEV